MRAPAGTCRLACIYPGADFESTVYNYIGFSHSIVKKEGLVTWNAATTRCSEAPKTSFSRTDPRLPSMVTTTADEFHSKE